MGTNGNTREIDLTAKETTYGKSWEIETFIKWNLYVFSGRT